MQRYDEKLLFPRKMPDYCRSCCDKGMRLRQNKGRRLECVVKGIKNGLRRAPNEINSINT